MHDWLTDSHTQAEQGGHIRAALGGSYVNVFNDAQEVQHPKTMSSLRWTCQTVPLESTILAAVIVNCICTLRVLERAPEGLCDKRDGVHVCVL